MTRHVGITSVVCSVLLLAACGGSDETAGGETANDYPTKQITLMVPYAAGAAPDSTARALAQAMEDDLGQRIVIQNIDGGSGTIGLSQLASAEPDGHTISWFASPSLTMQWQRIDTPFKGPETVQPVAQIVNVVPVLFAHADSGIDSVEDLVDKAKAAPGKVKIGLPNVGSQQDIAVRQLEEAAGIELDKTYFEAGKQVLPVVNGTVDVGVSQAGPVAQYVKRGDLNWVGVFGSQRLEGVDVPLINDSGYEVSYEAYEGLLAPPETPQSVVDRLSAAAEKAVDSDTFSKFVISSYGAASYLPADDLDKKITRDTETATELIQKYGLGSE